jgi:site-specific DNA-methyltransferase (adenine-specific)
MKGNNGTGNTIERDTWQTPQWLFNKLNKQYKFDFDCCASEENHKCRLWTDNFKIVEIDSADISWMNPPFSKAREMFEHFFKVIGKGICIYRCDNLETALWQEVILKNADWILIPQGRIFYEGKEGTGSRFPSALIGIGIEPPKDIEGVVLLVK